MEQLSCRHAQGLFTLVANAANHSSDDFVWVSPAHIWVFGHYLRGDWGNRQLSVIDERVATWRPYVNMNAASGFFRSVLRRDDAGDRSWFWAIEWNKSMRVIGGISRDSNPPSFMDDLPELPWSRPIRMPDGAVLRSRIEEPLRDGVDLLFGVDPSEFGRLHD